MSATSTMLRLATAVSENAGPNSTEFALAEAVINYLHRPIGLHPELRRVRDRLAQRLYSPAAERDLTTLLDLLTDKLALLESSAKVQPDATPDDQVQPEHTPPAPDEWNRTELKTEMQRIRNNVERWRRAGDAPGYQIWLRFLHDQESTLDALARADNVIHAQAVDLGALRDGDHRDERERLRAEVVRLYADTDALRQKVADLRGIADQQRKERDHFQLKGKQLREEMEILQAVALQANTDRASLRAEVESLRLAARAEAELADDARREATATNQARLATERELQDLRERRTREIADAIRVGWDASERVVRCRETTTLAEVAAAHLRELDL